MAGVKVKLYRLVERAVEEGIACGIARAQDQWPEMEAPQALTEEAREAHLREFLSREILNALDDVIDFGDEV